MSYEPKTFFSFHRCDVKCPNHAGDLRTPEAFWLAVPRCQRYAGHQDHEAHYCNWCKKEF